jgi:hypothetical protein
MAKSMEDRKLWIGAIYAGVVSSFPVLKKGAFKPDLSALCDKYDKNKDAYAALAKRKAGLSTYLQQLTSAMQTYVSAVAALGAQRASVYKDNNDMGSKYATQLGAFMSQGDKADTSKVTDALTGFVASFKELVELDKANADRKEKLDAQWEAGLKKICDLYAKESKEIQTAIDKLAADEDRLESQIRQLVLSYQKTAVQIDKPDLESALGKVLAGFP